jgi:hypothetical protein
LKAEENHLVVMPNKVAAANPEPLERPKRRVFTAREKLRILDETDRTGNISTVLSCISELGF